MLVFWLVERAGYRFPSAMRAIRSTFAGTHRPAFYQRNYREAVDYGFEFRKMPSPAPATVQTPSVSKESDPEVEPSVSLPLAAE